MTRLRALAVAGAIFACTWVLASAAVVADSSPSPSPASSPRTSATPSPSPVAAKIVLNPGSGPADSSVTVTGSAFPPGPVDLYLDLPSQQFTLSVGADSNGAFSQVVTVYSTAGAHNICSDGYGTSTSPTPQVTVCATFTITAAQPTIAVSPDSGPPGTQVAISGSRFPPTEIVALYIDSPNPFFGTPGPFADDRGNFSLTAPIPRLAGGTHNICGDTGPPTENQQFAVLACAHFTITGLDSSSPSPTPTTDQSPTPSTPSPTSTARPPARTTLSAFVIGSVAAGLAAMLAVGAGLFFWIRRRARPPS